MKFNAAGGSTASTPRRPRPASRPVVRARRHSRRPFGLARRCVSMGSSTVGNLSGGTPGCGAEPSRLLVRDAAEMAMPRASPQPPFRGDSSPRIPLSPSLHGERVRVRGRDTFQRWSLPLPLTPALSPQAGRGRAQPSQQAASGKVAHQRPRPERPRRRLGGKGHAVDERAEAPGAEMVVTSPTLCVKPWPLAPRSFTGANMVPRNSTAPSGY